MQPTAILAPVVVTLIHGTFDVVAAWADAKSPICRAISQELGSYLIIRKFEWSGRNSQNDRRSAAKKLLKHISDTTVHFPNSPHFLVGHSHGGNILRWALETAPSEASRNIAAAITVSTPFLEVRPREYRNGFRALLFLWRVVLLSSFGVGWVAFYSSHYEKIMNMAPDFFGALQIFGLLLVMWVPVLVIYKMVTSLGRNAELELLNLLDTRQRRMLSDNSSSVNLRQPFLCIYAKGDEVNYLFSGARRLVVASRLIEAILSKAARLYTPEYIAEMARDLTPFHGLIALALGVGSLFILIGNMAGHGTSAFLLVHTALPVAVVGLTMGLAVPFAMAVGIWLYGTAAAQDLVVAHFETTMTPAGVPALKSVVVTPAVARQKGVSRNMHTGILYSDEVARVIAEFIKGNIHSWST